MRGNLDYVIGGIGMRLGKESDDGFVDALPGRRVDKLNKNGAVRLQWMLQAKQRRGNGAGFGAGETHHADAAASRRRSYGDYGVVEVHGINTSGAPARDPY